MRLSTAAGRKSLPAATGEAAPNTRRAHQPQSGANEGYLPQDPLLRDRLSLRGQEDLEVSEHPGVGTEAARAREGALLPLGGIQSASFQKLVGPSSVPPTLWAQTRRLTLIAEPPINHKDPGNLASR